MRPKVSFGILKGARRNIPHDEPLGQSETKTITLRIHSIQVIPSGLLMSYRISLSEGVASVVSSRQRSGYYSFYHGLDGFNGLACGGKRSKSFCGLRRRPALGLPSQVSAQDESWQQPYDATPSPALQDLLSPQKTK